MTTSGLPYVQQLRERRDALIEARSRGVSVVEHESGNGIRRRTVWKSDAEMAAALAALEADIARLEGRRAPSFVRLRAVKGA